jgi:imidazolonepropionase-like amidohydrolase
LLVVDGNPLENMAVLQKKDNLKLIMKGGKIVKDGLS